MEVNLEDQEPAHTISEWLSSDIGSHDFVNITDLRALIEFGIFLTMRVHEGNMRDVEAYIEFGLWKAGKEVPLNAYSQAEFQKEILSDHRGGWANPDVPWDTYGVSGYDLSATLVRLLVGDPESAQYFGRGTSFRADIKQLKEAGF